MRWRSPHEPSPPPGRLLGRRLPRLLVTQGVLLALAWGLLGWGVWGVPTPIHEAREGGGYSGHVEYDSLAPGGAGTFLGLLLGYLALFGVALCAGILATSRLPGTDSAGGVWLRLLPSAGRVLLALAVALPLHAVLVLASFPLLVVLLLSERAREGVLGLVGMWAMLPAVVLFERQGPLDSLRRAAALGRAQWRHASGLAFGFWVYAFLLLPTVELIGLVLAGPGAGWVASGVALTGPSLLLLRGVGFLLYAFASFHLAAAIVTAYGDAEDAVPVDHEVVHEGPDPVAPSGEVDVDAFLDRALQEDASGPQEDPGPEEPLRRTGFHRVR